jgi:hypothetical protein
VILLLRSRRWSDSPVLTRLAAIAEADFWFKWATMPVKLTLNCRTEHLSFTGLLPGIPVILENAGLLAACFRPSHIEQLCSWVGLAFQSHSLAAVPPWPFRIFNDFGYMQQPVLPGSRLNRKYCSCAIPAVTQLQPGRQLFNLLQITLHCFGQRFAIIGIGLVEVRQHDMLGQAIFHRA